VVATKEEEVLRVLDLVAEQKEDSLQTLLATVDVVAEEEVVGRRREAAHFEQADEVRVLAVDVTDDLDGRGELDERRLREEDLARGLADGRNLGVLQAERLAHFARVADVEQPLDHVVHVQPRAVHRGLGRR
jgi:hypothetical protein